MKAVILEELTRKSWSGKSVLNKLVVGTKENIVEKANKYISERVASVNKIPVKKFTVEILTQRGKKVDSWSYSPTYR